VGEKSTLYYNPIAHNANDNNNISCKEEEEEEDVIPNAYSLQSGTGGHHRASSG
jgi:hypothetical protein